MTVPPRARLAFWLAVVSLPSATTAGAEPFTPTRDDMVLEQLPKASRTRELEAERAALARAPGQLDPALALAVGHLRLGQSEADPRHDGRAEAVLQPWWQLPEPPSAVLILRATLAQRRHDFGAALADLDRVLARSPRHHQALLTKATVLRVQGERASALALCERLSGRVGAVVRLGCAADATAGLAQADRHHRALIRALARQPATPEIRVWARIILAEGAAMAGAPGAAERHFQAALAEGLHHPYLLGAYADHLLDQGRAGAVLELLAAETRIDPLLLRHALAGRRLDTAGWRADVERLEARFETARRRGDRVHLREQARFALDLRDQPEQALHVALANWSVQREPADARLVLAAALAADRPQAALPVLDWLRTTGLQDARLRSLTRALEEAIS